MKFPDVAHSNSVLPATSSTTRRTAFATLKFIFLAALSLIICSLILSELIVSYPNWFISPNPLDLAEIEAKLQTLEWHARLHASALAFGAFVFVWFRIIIIGLQGLACLFGFESGHGHEHQMDRNKHIVSFCLFFLYGVIIINDSIFNRSREPELVASVLVSYFIGGSTSSAIAPAASSPSSIPTASAFAETIQSILPGAITRLTSMATRALPVCVAEVSVLFLVLYGIGWVSYCCHYRVHSGSEELNGNSQLPSHPLSNYNCPISFTSSSFSNGPGDIKSTLNTPSHNLCAGPGAVEHSLHLQVRCHSDEKISLDLPSKADAL